MNAMKQTSNYNTIIMKIVLGSILALFLVGASSTNEELVFSTGAQSLETNIPTSNEIKVAQKKLLSLSGFTKETHYDNSILIKTDKVKSEELKELEGTFLQGKTVVSPISPRVDIRIGKSSDLDGPFLLGSPETISFTKNELAVHLECMQILLRLIADKIKPLELKILNNRGLNMSWDTLNKMLQNTETRYCTSSDWELEKIYIDSSISLGPENSSISTPLYWCILNSLKIKAVEKLSLYENIGATAFVCEFIRLLRVDEIEEVHLVLTHDAITQKALEGDIMNVSNHKLLKNATEANLNKTVETLRIDFWPLQNNIGTEWTRGSGPLGPLNELSIKNTNITIPLLLYSAMVQNEVKMIPVTSFTFKIFGPSDFLSIYNDLFEKNSIKCRDENTKSINIVFSWRNDKMEDVANRSLILPKIKPLDKMLEWICTLYPKATSLTIEEGNDKINNSRHSEDSRVSEFALLSKLSISQSLADLLITSKVTLSGLSEDIELNKITFKFSGSSNGFSRCTNTVTKIEKKKGGEFHVDYTYNR